LSAGIALGQAARPGQQTPPPPPINQSDDPLLKEFRWRSIGPASMGGRIDDIEGVESNPSTFYIGLATGGVWKTINNGTTFNPIFDTYPVSSIGDLAISQSDPNIIWVGTGEPNNRQSSSFGDGVYKSTDAGKTFAHLGLKETQTIARVVIDHKDNNTVYVAAVGHLFGPNPERGIYKTTDGGKSWALVKFIDQDTGFTDIVMDPVDNNTLYAASYQRRRTPFGFNGGGPGSGIWKTTDAGKTWVRIEGAGLPKAEFGRIGIDVSRSNPSVVYAQIEVGPSPGTGGGEDPRGGGGGFGGGQGGQRAQDQPPNPERSGVWRSDDKGKSWRIMSNNNNRPMYYSQIRIDPKNDQIVYTMGAPFYKSTDGGKVFQVVQGIAHSDHHALWIDPNNTNHLVLGNDGGLDVSYDQGATWDFINTMALAQLYAIAVDMRKPYYVYGGLQDNGSWGGPSATRNPAGITNSDWFRIGGGDGFYVQIDPTDHNTIYVESQNGNVRRLNLGTGESVSIRPRSARPAQQRPRPQGAGANPEQAQAPQQQPAQSGQSQAGGQQQAPPQPPQGFGGFGQPATSNIVPEPPPGEQYRFNWSTPIHISPHNPRTVYIGANKLFKSVDRGDTWTASPDLTKQTDRNKLSVMGVALDKPMASKNDGVGAYGTITTVAESPVLPGVLWVGTDDGNVQVSRDGGATWTNVAKNIAGIPVNHQIARVEPSHFEAGTCYVAIDGHRNDDHKPYIFVTRDFGATWKSISNNLPPGNVNEICEDHKNKNLLFVGTEYGLYISLNGGAIWKRFMTGLPTVRVDDIHVHPRDNDLIVGTHGRGAWIIDDITPLQHMDDTAMAADVHLFDIRAGTQWMQDVTLSRYIGGAKHFQGSNPQPGTAISYLLKSVPSGDVKIAITDITGKVLRNLNGTKEAGLNRVQWNLRGDAPPRQGGPGGRGGGGRGAFAGPPIQPGAYLVKLSVGGKEYTKQVQVEEDIWMNK
jgi:photosystem II stability/assembly factor-like uncharacterized protein